MEKELLIASLKRINAGSGRTFTQEQAEYLYMELKHLDDKLFKTCIDDFCSLENQPKNIEAFIKNRVRELLAIKREREESYWERDNNRRYTQIDMKLFFKILETARVKFHGTGQYQTWMEFFNRKWIELNGKELTEFMEAVLLKLKEENTELKEARP